MKTITVKPAGTGRETLYLGLAILLVAAVSGAFIITGTRNDDNRALLPYQISGYANLNPTEQGTFTDLYAAGLEIDALHDQFGDWSSVQALAEEYISPFVRDQTWDKRGGLLWTELFQDKADAHVAAYLGRPTKSKTNGSFLLLMAHTHKDGVMTEGLDDHEHQPFTIWYFPAPNVSAPSILTEPALIKKGWKEVVAYRGEEEVQRLSGGNS